MAKKLNVEELVKALRAKKVWDAVDEFYRRDQYAADLADMIEECSTEEPGCDCTEAT